jgi:flagellar biosynthesis anti-sigma factor FlgM
MPIRIGDIRPQSIPDRSVRFDKPQATTPQPPSQSASTQASTLDISAIARQALQTLPAVRADRVAALRQQLQSGQYKVQGHILADRILGQ